MRVSVIRALAIETEEAGRLTRESGLAGLEVSDTRGWQKGRRDPHPGLGRCQRHAGASPRSLSVLRVL